MPSLVPLHVDVLEHLQLRPSNRPTKGFWVRRTFDRPQPRAQNPFRSGMGQYGVRCSEPPPDASREPDITKPASRVVGPIRQRPRGMQRCSFALMATTVSREVQVRRLVGTAPPPRVAAIRAPTPSLSALSSHLFPRRHYTTDQTRRQRTADKNPLN
jgi:hypothetical protein